jgi:hypothetical protein
MIDNVDAMRTWSCVMGISETEGTDMTQRFTTNFLA